MACRSCEQKKQIWRDAWSFLNKYVQLEENGDWYKVMSISSQDGPIAKIGLFMGEEENLKWIFPNQVRDVADTVQN
jgi:hypothetical protein